MITADVRGFQGGIILRESFDDDGGEVVFLGGGGAEFFDLPADFGDEILSGQVGMFQGEYFQAFHSVLFALGVEPFGKTVGDDEKNIAWIETDGIGKGEGHAFNDAQGAGGCIKGVDNFGRGFDVEEGGLAGAAVDQLMVVTI